MQDNQTLALFGIWQSGDAQANFFVVIAFAKAPTQFFFHTPMGNHLAADFRKSTQASRDVYETFFVDVCNVSSDVPAILDRGAGKILSIGVALHHIGARNQQHAVLTRLQFIIGIGRHNSRTDAGQGTTHRSFHPIGLKLCY